jgi:hypothetical protein
MEAAVSWGVVRATGHARGPTNPLRERESVGVRSTFFGDIQITPSLGLP